MGPYQAPESHGFLIMELNIGAAVRVFRRREGNGSAHRLRMQRLEEVARL